MLLIYENLRKIGVKAEIKNYDLYIYGSCDLKKGSGTTGISDPVAEISMEQLKKIAEEKLPDLNTNNIDHAAKIIAGTARSMGVEVIK